MGLLTPEEVPRRIGDQQDRAARAKASRLVQRLLYCRPMATAAEDLIDTIENPEGRLMFGLPSLDFPTRGIGKGEMCVITGSAHSGKTQLVLNAIANNPDAHILMFTPDEVDQLVLAKLVAMSHGMNLEQVEEAIRDGSRKVKEMVRRAAAERYPNLLVVDQTIGFAEMKAALEEAEDFWGEACEAIVYDYLDLLPGEADYTSTKGKSTGMKRFVKSARVAGLIIHQPKRTGARRGQLVGMDDLHMAGDKEATFVFGVYRKRDDEDLDDVDRLRHEDTVSVHLSKNKRPPCKTGTWDLHLAPRTGVIREITDADWLRPGMPFRHAAEAMEARANLVSSNAEDSGMITDDVPVVHETA